MFFFPYSTDAPIYHWPIATATIILLNIVAFVATFLQVYTGNLEPEQIEWLALTFDQINPLQWLTHSFLHMNPIDLIINMLFLWSFGMVIEGKVGGLWFTVIYFGTHLICGALAQSIFFSLSFLVPELGELYAIGSNNAIFALLAMALIWAPENEMSCVFLVIVPRLGRMGGGLVTEFKISTLATAYLFIQMILFFFLGPLIWQAGFHLLSMLMGAVLALVMVRLNWVDCEDWDIIARNEWLHGYPILCSEERRLHFVKKEDVKYDAVTLALETSSSPTVSHSAYMAARSGTMSRTNDGKQQKLTPKSTFSQPRQASNVSGRRTGAADPNNSTTTANGKQLERPPSRQQQAQAHPEFNRLSMLFRTAITQKSLMMADQHFRKLTEHGIVEGVSDQTLFNYVSLLAANKHFLPALKPLKLIVDRGGPSAMDARLRIAQVQLKVMQQPGEAIKTLRRIEFPVTSGDQPREQSLNEAQQKIIGRRNALLEQCGVKPPPQVAKPTTPK